MGCDVCEKKDGWKDKILFEIILLSKKKTKSTKLLSSQMSKNFKKSVVNQ
mgnify:CR=1 FL=1